MTSPSIVHVGLENPSWRIGGLNRYLAKLRDAQQELGQSVDVVWCDDTDAPGAVPVGLSWLRRWRAFAREIRRSDADIVDVHFPAHAAWAILSGALRRRPLVVHFQGPWALESAVSGDNAWSVRAKSLVEGYVLRRADRVVTLSAAFRDVAVQRYSVAPHRIDVIAPGVDIFPDNDPSSFTREGSTERVLLIVRRLVPRMGIDAFIQWFADEGRQDERLVIIGDGSARSDLEALARSSRAASRISFLGRVSDEELNEWYSRADVSVVPTVAHEGFGLVVLESLAHGTPVVVTDVDGLKDAARVSSAVALVSRDTPQWRRALDGVADPSLRVTAYRDACAHSWSSVAERHAALYDALRRGEQPRGVVILDHTAKLSGGELAIVRTIGALDDRSWRAHLLLAETGPLCDVLDERGISYEVLALDPRVQATQRSDVGRGVMQRAVITFAYALRVRRTLRRRQPSVVHTNSMKAHLYGALASPFASWALVTHVRDVWAPPYLGARTSRLLRWMTKWCPHDVIANSALTGRATGVNAAVIPSPVEDRFYELPPAASGAVVRLAIVGRLAPWKGQDLLIAALGTLRHRADWSLLIVGGALFGEDAYAEALPHAVDEAGIAGRVTFTGHVRDVAAVLGDVDVVILASRSPEPFGNVIAEAMAAGRVVIVPDAGGVREFVNDGTIDGNGVVFAPNDVDALAAAIVRVLDSSIQREYWGVMARATAERFRAAHVADDVATVYDHLV